MQLIPACDSIEKILNCTLTVNFWSTNRLMSYSTSMLRSASRINPNFDLSTPIQYNTLRKSCGRLSKSIQFSGWGVDYNFCNWHPPSWFCSQLLIKNLIEMSKKRGKVQVWQNAAWLFYSILLFSVLKH